MTWEGEFLKTDVVYLGSSRGCGGVEGYVKSGFSGVSADKTLYTGFLFEDVPGQLIVETM